MADRISWEFGFWARTTGFKFKYVNHHGEDHEYLVWPRELAFDTYDERGKRPGVEPQWVLHAEVEERDGERRGYMRRTFIFSHIRDPQVLA